MNDDFKQEYIDSLLSLGYTQQEAEDQYNEELKILGDIGSADIPKFTILESEFDEFYYLNKCNG